MISAFYVSVFFASFLALKCLFHVYLRGSPAQPLFPRLCRVCPSGLLNCIHLLFPFSGKASAASPAKAFSFSPIPRGSAAHSMSPLFQNPKLPPAPAAKSALRLCEAVKRRPGAAFLYFISKIFSKTSRHRRYLRPAGRSGSPAPLRAARIPGGGTPGQVKSPRTLRGCALYRPTAQVHKSKSRTCLFAFTFRPFFSAP